MLDGVVMTYNIMHPQHYVGKDNVKLIIRAVANRVTMILCTYIVMQFKSYMYNEFLYIMSSKHAIYT